MYSKEPTMKWYLDTMHSFNDVVDTMLGGIQQVNNYYSTVPQERIPDRIPVDCIPRYFWFMWRPSFFFSGDIVGDLYGVTTTSRDSGLHLLVSFGLMNSSFEMIPIAVPDIRFCCYREYLTPGLWNSIRKSYMHSYLLSERIELTSIRDTEKSYNGHLIEIGGIYLPSLKLRTDKAVFFFRDAPEVHGEDYIKILVWNYRAMHMWMYPKDDRGDLYRETSTWEGLSAVKSVIQLGFQDLTYKQIEKYRKRSDVLSAAIDYNSWMSMLFNQHPTMIPLNL